MGTGANRSQSPEVILATAAGCWEMDEDSTPLTEALDAEGVGWRAERWDDPGVGWGDAALVVVRSTWDYAPRRGEFVAWAARVAEQTELANPAPVIEWNTDKSYLTGLAERGIPVVSTRFVEPEAASGLAEALESVASGGEVVVKPAVSAGSKNTGRFGHGELDRALGLATDIHGRGGTVMLQPYMPSVDTHGETGLVLFEGRLSHAFNKGPMLERGADPEPGLYAPERIRPAEPTAAEVGLAGSVLGAATERFGTGLLFARVDMVADDDGSPVLMELELTEPCWFLTTDPGAAERAASAIARRVRH